MVIFYDIDTKKICMIEYYSMFPTLPANMTKEEIIEFYKDKENMSFVSIPDANRPNGDIFGYDLSFDEKGEFLGLTPRENN